MKIAIDALGIHNVGGGRTATLNLLESLSSIDTCNQYQIFLSSPEPTLNTEARNIQQYIVPMKNRLLLRLWAQLCIPFLSRDFDLIHFLKNLGVFGIRIPSVVTIYDLTILEHPELFPKIDVYYWKTAQKHFLQKVTNIIAISNNTANDLNRYYNTPKEKIVVIYPSISPLFTPVSEIKIANIKQKYDLPEKYFIHVGHIDSKKNLSFLVQAFYIFRNRTNINAKLVLVGEPYPRSPDLTLYTTIQKYQLEEEIIFTGKVPLHDLPSLYSGALAAVYPTLHEGFGLGPVEAMACGIPLIAHRAGAIQEAAGEAAIIIENLDLEMFADALVNIAIDEGLSRDLIRKGLLRAKQFQGNHSAHATIKLYQSLARR